MRNHRLVDEALEYLIKHKNNQYYLDDIFELIAINQFGNENSDNLRNILRCLSDYNSSYNGGDNGNGNDSLNNSLRFYLYSILNSNNGYNCINKLLCKL